MEKNKILDNITDFTYKQDTVSDSVTVSFPQYVQGSSIPPGSVTPVRTQVP